MKKEIELLAGEYTESVGGTKYVVSTPELTWHWLHNFLLEYKKKKVSAATKLMMKQHRDALERLK